MLEFRILERVEGGSSVLRGLVPTRSLEGTSQLAEELKPWVAGWGVGRGGKE